MEKREAVIVTSKNIQVPFGYEPAKEAYRGTLLIYDAFEPGDKEEPFVPSMMQFAVDRSLAKIVGYVLGEATLKRMKIPAGKPYYSRIDSLGEFLEPYRSEESPLQIALERFEEKRGKYTPFDTAMRFVQEKYDGPLFVGMRLSTANRLAGFGALDDWIRRVRFVLSNDSQEAMHPILESRPNRWDML
ncbi:hypothetical protein [Paenibacillus gansuensis]|uniref:Uncharacterized protein n=1 Tax=Paenibacillus gansuensis TaxID=306542 RepID=A0ABW5PBJ1_9BACL